MENILKYSILRYSPSLISGEAINLGILYSNESNGFRLFRYPRKLERILKFDDTLKKEDLMNLLVGIEKEIGSNSSDQRFDIEAFTKYYINSFSFSKVQSIKYSDMDNAVDELYSIYFRFDLPKEIRPTKKQDYEFLSGLIKASGKPFKKNELVHGQFDDSIRYDFVMDDFCIKIFDFDEKDLKKMINSAKIWAWNCNHENKKVFILFRYSNSDMSENSFKTIESIFDESKGFFKKIEEAPNLFQQMS